MTSRVQVYLMAPLSRARVLVLLLVAMLPSTVFGQSTGGVSGHVSETEGPLPGARITVNGADTPRQSFADQNGTFAISNLPPGQHTLTAEVEGFRTERRHIDVRAGETTNVDITLRVGCLGETLTITSHPPPVEPVLAARSDVVAYLRVDRVVEEDSPMDPDCHVPYSVTFIRTMTRPSYSGPDTGIVNIWLTGRVPLEPGNEYIIWVRRSESDPVRRPESDPPGRAFILRRVSETTGQQPPFFR